MAYNWKNPEQGKGGLSTFEGFKILKGTTHWITRPRGDKGFLRFRIMPALNEQGVPQISPFSPDKPEEFGDWIKVEPTVNYWGVGQNRLTCLARCSDTPEGEKSPAETFYWAIWGAMKHSPQVHENWLYWAHKNADRKNKGISAIRPTVYLQAVVTHEQGKLLKGSDGKVKYRWPTVVMIPGSVLEEGFPNSLVNVVVKHNIGDFLGEGRLFTLDFVPPNNISFAHYDVLVERDVANNFVKAPLNPTMLASWKPWDQILRKLTEAEQTQYIARYFPPDAVDFALGTTRFAKYLPPEVLGAWFKRSTMVSTPNMVLQPNAVAPYNPPMSPNTTNPVVMPPVIPTVAAPYVPAPVDAMQPPQDGGWAAESAGEPFDPTEAPPEEVDFSGMSNMPPEVQFLNSGGSNIDPQAARGMEAAVKARLLAAQQQGQPKKAGGA